MIKMKKYTLTIFFSFLFLLVYNSTVISQEKRDFRLSVGGGFVTIQNRLYYSPGIEGEYFLSHNWALNYSLGYGKSERGDVQFHFPLGWLAIPFACDPEAIILCVMIPEGFSYHIYPNEKMEIAPYLNLLQAQCVLSDEEEFNILSGAGVRVHFRPVEKFSITLQYGISVPYNRPDLCISGGISLGMFL